MTSSPSSASWEFENSELMLSLLVGRDFGSNPEEKLDLIRASKAQKAEHIIQGSWMTKNCVAIELGSGCGFISKVVADAVKNLHCIDVSASFLEVAKRECREKANISFHQVKNYNLSFLPPQSVDVVYAYNVFIHFNLFDIYWYLNEFKRIIKPGGRLWFDIANGEQFKESMPALFLEMATHYKENPSDNPTLVQWNSVAAIQALGEHFGFSLTTISSNSELIFTR